MITYSGELISNKSKKRAKKLYQIEYDKYNWSWLLDPNKPDEPHVIPRDETSTKDTAGSTSNVTRGRLV